MPLNPLDIFIDNPNNPFEQAKKFAGQAVEDVLASETGQGIMEKAATPLTYLDRLAVPYREYVAPALTGTLLTLNSNYRAQNKNLSVYDQFKLGQKLSKTSVPGEQEWRKAISPGRALVGLIGNANFMGTQGTDKLDWSDAKQVNDYFTSGSAQFWSGVADLGFNLLDPVAALAGKSVKMAKKATLTRPLGSRYGKVENLVAAVDDGVDATSKSPVRPLIDMVEKDPDNLRVIANHNFVNHSGNVTSLALALSNGYKFGGRQGVADVIKASMGHKPTLDKLAETNVTLQQQILDNTGTSGVIRNELKDLNKAERKKTTITPEEKEVFETNRKELNDKIDALNEENAKLAAQGTVGELFEREAITATSTFSVSPTIERIRASAAKTSQQGMFIDTGSFSKRNLSKMVAKDLGLKTPVVRALMWVTPNQPLKEVPSGLAFLDGAPGERSFQEFDARLRQIGKLTDWSAEEQIKWSQSYRGLLSKSERFNAFQNLEEHGINSLLQKYFGKTLEKMNPAQQEAATVFAREMVGATRRAKAREIDSLNQKSYTVLDKVGGESISYTHQEELVEGLAARRAAEDGGRPVSEVDRIAVRSSMSANPLTSTQVPNIHYQVDMKFFDKIMGENPRLIKKMLDGILEEDWDVSKVRSMMQEAERKQLLGGNDVGYVAKTLGTVAMDVAVEAMDTYYTYVWKPFTLLSLKYTTRNVAEGWLRVAASMVDFSSQDGFGWTEMVTALKDSGSVARYLGNQGVRKQSGKAKKEFDQRTEDMKFDQGLIKKQLGEPTTSAKGAATVSRDAMLSAAKREEFKNHDGMTLCIKFSQRQLDQLKKYKSFGVPEADAAVKTMQTDVFDALNNTTGYGSKDADALIAHLSAGEYNEALRLSNMADPVEMMKAIAKYRDNVEKALVQLNKHNLEAETSVKYAVENTKFALGRLQLHADKTIDLIKTRAEMQGNLAKIAGETAAGGKITKSFSGINQTEIYPGVKIDASLAGEADTMLREATSSRASATRVLANETSITGHGMMSNGFARTAVNTNDSVWPQAHADYVNNVLMKDAVARKMVEHLADGKSVSDAKELVRTWIDSADQEAIAWKREVKQNMSEHSKSMDTKFTYDDQLDVTHFQIEQYLPTGSEVPGVAYDSIHAKALDGLTPTESAKINLRDRHPVMAARELHDVTFGNMYKNAVAKVFAAIGTLPEDHLVRHPFFNMVHDNEAKRIAKIYASQARKMPGATDESVRLYVEKNAPRIKEAAVNRAYKELMQRLYSVERYTDPGKFIRFITPFYMAHQNSSRFWLGTTLRNPETAYMLAKAYNAPYRAGYVFDEEGNIVSEGNPWDKDTAKQTVEFTAPSWIRGFTGKEKWGFNPGGLDIIFQGQAPIVPTLGGPAGEVIGGAAIREAAKRTNIDSFLQDQTGMSFDEVSNKYILPFYTKNQGLGTLAAIESSGIPFNSATISLLAAIAGNTGHLPIIEDAIPDVKNRWISRYLSAREQVVVEMTMNGEALDESVIEKRASDIAQKSLIVESVSSFVGPVVAVKMNSEKTKALSQRLKTLQGDPAYGYNGGALQLAKELDEQGIAYSNGIVSALMATTTTNRFGFMSNTETVKNVQSNLAMLEKADLYKPDNPFIGELFNVVGPNSEYSPIADDNLYTIKVNDKPVKSRDMSPVEAERQAQMRAAWSDYFTNLDAIKADAESKGIKKGTPEYQKYEFWQDNLYDLVAKQYPIWAEKEDKITLHKSDSYIELATMAIADKQFMATAGKNNKAIAGLQQYMIARGEILAQLEQSRALTGVQGLDTKANRYYSIWMANTAQAIINDYPEFKQMYNRYLSNDELNVIGYKPMVDGVK